MSPRSSQVAAMALIVLVGLLNFHVPHFLIGRAAPAGYATYVLEVVLLANVLGAGMAALGIYLDQRWGWLLSVLIAAVSVALYFVQETVGLPGFEHRWLEPSRLLSLVVEATFVVLASVQLQDLQRRAQ